MKSCNVLAPALLTQRSTWQAMLFTVLVWLLAQSGTAIAASAASSAAQVQFGGQCTEGLAEGQHVMTDCKTTWTDKDGKIYCFSNEAAKKSFLENPDRESAAGARFHGRQQRGIHREGHAELHRHRCRSTGQGGRSTPSSRPTTASFRSMIRSTAST